MSHHSFPAPVCQEHRSPAFYAVVSAMAAVLLALIGLAALYAWYAQVTLAARVFPGRGVMEANVAAGLFLAGVSLWWQRMPREEPDALQRLQKGVAQLLGLTLLLLGVATLSQILFDIDLRIDRLLFLANPESSGTALPHPDRMAPPTVIAFMLAGISLMLLDVSGPHRHFAAEYCALALAALMAIPLVGHLYDAPGLTRLAAGKPIAPQTALAFLLLAAGLLAARPRHRFMALWNSTQPGGQLLRWLLPKSLALLIVLHLAVNWAAKRGSIDQETATPLTIVLVAGWLALLFWRAAVLLDRQHDARRRGEEALSESNAILRAVSDNTPDAIYVKDRAGRMIFANPATLRMLDRNASAIIGRTNAEIFRDPAEARMVDEVERRALAGGKPQMVEETLHFSYGSRTFHSTKAPWMNERGEILGLVCISTDITERKRMEDALKAHETHLESLVTARTAEVSELIAHLESTREEEKRAIARELHDDLGSALTALNMHLAILFQQIPADAKLAERSGHIRSLLNSVTQTTRRIQAGLRPDKLDIFGIKTALVEQGMEFENYTGIHCRVDLPDEDLNYPQPIDIALFRMVQEALNNVAKHARANRVDIVLDDLDDHVVLSIRDDGVGMDADQQAGSATHGLRGMRERASYLGGDVKIVSEPGRGTSIVVTLPKTPVRRRQGGAPGSARPDGGATGNQANGS